MMQVEVDEALEGMCIVYCVLREARVLTAVSEVQCSYT